MLKKKSHIDNLENIAFNFEKMNDDYVFMKEELVKFDYEDEGEKIKINFKECHVAICPNGGLIAICKKKGFLDITRGTKLNKYIVIMYQNGKRKILIPIDWNYKVRWVIDLEFNEKEQLYAICNDGTIYKMDILTQKAVQKKSTESFKNEPIVKAKLIENGFIALTVDTNFYYIKDIKDPFPKLLFPMALLHFSYNVDFLAIPPNKSKSGRLELLITNEKGIGVIHIEENDGEGKFSLKPSNENPQIMECKGASIIIKDRVEPYYINFEETPEPEKVEAGTQFEKLGKIAALAISPKKDQIAVYDFRGFVFFFYSNFEEGQQKKVIINLNEEFSSEDLIEQQQILNFEDGGQFLYCGEDAVALCGYRFIFIINALSEPKVFKITEKEKMDPTLGSVFCKCISEVDGIRFLTNEGIYFISRVSNELVEICEPFSVASSKKLLKAYENSINKKTNSEKLIREIKDNLSDAIYKLQIAAANIFWTKIQEDREKKDAQMFLLEAAQHAKCFVKKEVFNFDRFYQMCKDIRTVNNLRNHPTKPKLITYNEYKSMISTSDLIQKVIRSLNFGLAFKICQYLEENVKRVYEKYAIACIKKIANDLDEDEEIKTFEVLNDKLKGVENFSYINLAKKSFKYKKDIMGMKFLENEKSILAKLPKYIDKEEWNKILELSENINDIIILMSIFEKIFKKTTVSDFVELVGKYPKLKTYVIEFLKNNAPNKLDDYMELLKNPEEMFFFAIEQYFQSSEYSDRRKYISIARENLKLIDNTVNPNFDHKFYKSYIDSLDHNLSFKIECLNSDKKIIPRPETTSFDISIYDIYKLGVQAEKTAWIESKNKNFYFSSEGMMIMKMMAYGEINRIGELGALVAKNPLKKLSLTNLNVGELFYKFKDYENAAKYLKLASDPFYFDYKIDLLKSADRLEEALDIIISDKNIENPTELVKEILNRKPKLIRVVKKMAEQYKVTLDLQ